MKTSPIKKSAKKAFSPQEQYLTVGRFENAMENLKDFVVSAIKASESSIRRDMDAGFQRVDERFQKVDQNFEITWHAISEHSKEIIGLKKDVSEIKIDVGVLKQDVSGLKQDVAKLNTDLTSFRQDVSCMEERLSKKIDGNRTVLNNHEIRITALERSA